MAYPSTIALGIFGGAMYLYVTYCTFRVLRNIQIDEETALTKFLIDPDVTKAFKVLALSTAVTALLFTARVIIVYLEINLPINLFVLLLPVPLLGVVYFFHVLRKATHKA